MLSATSLHPAMSTLDATDDGFPTLRLVAPDGAAVGATVGLSAEDLGELLRLMMFARRLDRECMALQRQGELTVYPPFEGQEAAQVGSAFALGRADMAFPSFRELAAAIVRGVDVVEYLQYHRGPGTAGRTTRARTGSRRSACRWRRRSCTPWGGRSARSSTGPARARWCTSGTARHPRRLP